MGDKSKFGIECIISRNFPHLQSDNMESCASSKSNLSESSSWDFDTMCQNTAKLDEMMSSMKQGQNVSCNVCNKRNDTLARREDITWQREEIIHTREKELREWELMLEEKNRLLIEKEKKLKHDGGKVLQIESIHNSRKSSLSDGLDTLTSEQHTKQNINNEIVLEREKLLKEKEKIIFEKMENILKKERSVDTKEQQLNNQIILFKKERDLVVQKTHSLDLREQVVQKVEVAIERKLKGIYEERKSLDERNIILSQKENALSSALEYIQNKEKALNERENMIIEKERNIIQQVSDLGKHTGTESPNKENQELFNNFDEIFYEKWKSIQERENTIANSEQILLQKWKEISEAKEFLKSEEESLQTCVGTFEKEKKILREWDKLLEKREKEIEEKHELITGNVGNNRKFRSDDSVSTWPSSLDVQTETDFRMNRGSPFGAVGQLFNGDINLKLSDADKHVNLSREAPNSENQEISGDELFRYYEKEKESVHALLLKENADSSTNSGESSNSDGNQEITDSVKACFKKKINAIPSLEENTDEQGVSVSEINSKTSKLPFDVRGESNKEEIPLENILTNAAALNSKNNILVYSGNQFTKNDSSLSFKKSVFLPIINKESDKKNNVILSGAETDTSVKTMDVVPNFNKESDAKSNVVFTGVKINTTVKTMEKNSTEQSKVNNMDDKIDSTSRNSTEFQNPQGGSVSQDSRSMSPKCEKMQAENYSVENGDEPGKTNEISNTSVSPASSASSRSLTSPISGRSSPWSRQNKRKPAKDALLQAISMRNFLETVQLLDTNCMSLEIRNEKGRSAALLAVECGNIELVERLMNKGADIKACDYKGYSALHIAVTENNSEMALFLLKKGLNPLITDVNGNTAIKLASNLKSSTLLEVMNKYITANYT